jgi:predicted nucleotidyltransferase
MNADLDQAVGLFDAPRAEVPVRPQHAEMPTNLPVESHWRWRLRMAERIALEIDPDRFGVKAIYVIGSVKNASAGPCSDVDLLIHVTGDGPEREQLGLWLEGWSEALAEMNYLRTGYQTGGLLDVHYLTDEDIERRSSYAAKIGAATDAARELPLAPRDPAS